MGESQKVAEFLVPDADYIRRDVPMSDVVKKLGLDVRGRWVLGLSPGVRQTVKTLLTVR
jgi:hypothetical protein